MHTRNRKCSPGSIEESKSKKTCNHAFIFLCILMHFQGKNLFPRLIHPDSYNFWHCFSPIPAIRIGSAQLELAEILSIKLQLQRIQFNSPRAAFNPKFEHQIGLECQIPLCRDLGTKAGHVNPKAQIVPNGPKLQKSKSKN